MGKPHLKAIGAVCASFALGCLLLSPSKLFAQAVNTLCAVVQLKIGQQAALEREAFNASLQVDNNVINAPLTNLKVQVFIKDANGAPADSLFFVKITTLTGTNAVDGTGVVQSSSSANIQWLIIPSTGSGGTNPAGQRYGVTATINAISNGAPQTVTTFDAFITVNPQPVLKLEYALPFEVFGQEPLLTTITPVIPFPLAVRATNIGFGPANNFQIQSAQPQITDNKLGLAVDFQLLGTVVAGKNIPNTLLIPFGAIAPNGVSQAYWNMTATLSGRFISFTSTFSHAADLGGQLTSLLQSVTTYTLIKDVLVDLPGRDQVPDFLVNETGDRGQMQTQLDFGVQPAAQFILESDQPMPLPVAEIPGLLSGNIGAGSAALTYTLASAVSPNVWVHSYMPWSYPAGLSLSYTKRADGKVINPANVWISKHFVKSSRSYIYWLNLLDLTTSTNTYTVVFSSAGLEQPPSPVSDFTALPSSAQGSISLAWSAPSLPLLGGTSNYLFGAHYFIDAEQSSATFSPSNAQVSFTTSTPSGARQSYTDAGLVGNTTYFLAIFTQDTGGNMSGISNIATGYALPNPPTNLLLSSVTATKIAANWQVGNNSLPIDYQLRVATSPTGLAIASSPYQDSFSRSFVFTGLSPGTTYFILGVGHNPATGVASPSVMLGSTMTSTTLDDALAPRTTLAFGAPSLSSAPFSYVSNLTTFTLAAIDDRAVVGDGSGAGVAQTFLAVNTTTFALQSGTFSLTTEGLNALLFYSVDKVGNTEAVHRSTVALDLTPPSTKLSFSGFAASGAAGGFLVSPATLLVLASTDPVSGGVASGVGSLFYTIDSDPRLKACAGAPFIATAPAGTCSNPGYTTPFSLSVGTHTVYYFAQDNVRNFEAVKIASVTVDATPPALALFPVAQSTVTSATPTLAAVYSDPAAGIVPASVRLSLDGVDVTTRSLITASSATFISTAALAEGAHTLSASVANAAGLTATTTATFFVDLPPVTTLQVGVPQFSAAGGLFVATTTPLGFSTSKPARTSYAVDAGSFTVFSTSFTLASEGNRRISYFSVDPAGATESPRASAVTVDATPPATQIFFVGALSTGPANSFTISSNTAVGLSAVDPASSSPASGLTQTFLQIDGGSVTVYAKPAGLPVGTHALVYYSVDHVGNQEAYRQATIMVTTATVVSASTAAPVTSLQVQGPQYFAGGTAYVSPASSITLSATDYSGTGINHVEVILDSGPVETYSVPLHLPEGYHAIQYRAVDNAGNAEQVHTVTSTSDGTPPVSILTVDGSTVPAGSLIITSTDALRVLAGDALSGVAAIYTGIDGQVPAVAGSTATQAFALPVGTHTVVYYAVDRVQNAEASHSAAITVVSTSAVAGSTLPVTAIQIVGPQYFANGNAYVSPVSSITLIPTDFSGTGINHIDLVLDQGPPRAYSGPFPLTEGVHAIQYRAVDNAGDIGLVRSATIYSDATTPITQLTFSGTYSTGPANTFTFASNVAVSFSTQDPVANGVASGVSQTRYQLDGGTVAVYGAPFAVVTGSHTLVFASVDNVGNQEARRFASLIAVAASSGGAGAFRPGPTSLTPVTDNRTLSLSWDPNGNQPATTYLVAYATTSGTSCGGSSPNILPTTATAISLTGLLPATSYFLAVCNQALFSSGGPSLACNQPIVAQSGSNSFSGCSSSTGTPPGAGTSGVEIGPVSVINATSNSLTLSWGTNSPSSNFTILAGPAPSDGSCPTGNVFTQTFQSQGASYVLNVPQPGNYAVTVCLPGSSYPSQGCDPIILATTGSGLFVTCSGTTGPPATTLLVNSTTTIPAFISPTEPVAFAVTASALGQTFYAVDQDPPTLYNGQFALRLTTEGPHALNYYSVDALGRAEALKTTPFSFDGTAPTTMFLINGTTFFPTPFFVNATAYETFSFKSTDALSGVSTVTYTIDGGAEQGFGAPFGLTVGTHTLSFAGVDNAGNTRRDFIYVIVATGTPEATGLATSLMLDGIPLAASHRLYVNPSSQFAFAVTQPAQTYYSIDDGSTKTYASPFTLAATDGAHLITYFSSNTAAVEQPSSSTLVMDTRPPVTVLAINGVATSESVIHSTSTAYFTLTATDAVSGVQRTFLSIDGVPQPMPGAPFTLTIGTHTLDFHSEDSARISEAAHHVLVFSSPGLTILPLDGSFVTTARPAIAARYDGTGVDTGTVHLILDGLDVTAFAAVTASSVSAIPAQDLSQGSHTVTAQAGGFTASSIFFLDTLTPVTRLLVDGIPTPASSLTVSSTETITLSATDSGSGVAQILYRLNGQSPQVFSSTYLALGGSNQLSFYAVDRAGNLEAPHLVTINVVLPPPITLSGVAIGRDPSGSLWEVVQQNFSDYMLRRFGPDNATPLFSAALPQGAANSNWSLRFDGLGNAYAVGGSSTPQGGTDLAIYAVSPSGVLLSTAGFHAGLLGNSLAFDASGDLWIAGGLQTGSFQNGTAQVKLALWQFCFHTGRLSLMATYARGNGGDAGFGVRVSSPIVWVAGYSAATSMGLGGALDLALWGFDAGSGLLAKGPYFVPGVLPNGAGDGTGAKLELAGGLLDVVASRQSGASRQVGFYQFDQNGNVLLAQAWTPASGAAPGINGIALDNAGRVVAAGELRVSSTSTTAGLWRYGQNGAFLGAFTDPPAPGAATGIVSSTTTYLAVAGSGTPYPFSFGTTLSGTNVLLSSSTPAADTTPPVTTLLVDGLPAGATNLVLITTDTIGFSATDAGTGVAQTRYSINGGTQQVYGAPFSLPPGAYTIAYHSIDFAGNVETARSVNSTIRVYDVTPPMQSLSPIGGSTVTTATPLIFAVYSDTGTGVNLVSLNITLDGVNVTSQAVVTASSASLTPSTLAQGGHTLAAAIADYAGNVSSASSSFFVDSIPPMTTVVIGTPQVGATPIFIATTTPLSFTVSRPAQTFYALDAGAFGLYGTSFTIASGGSHAIRYYSADQAGVTETVRTSTVVVDALPPRTSFAAGAPSYSTAAFYAAAATTFSLTAFDDLAVISDAAGAGVARTVFAVDASTFSPYSGIFGIAAQGAHTVRFYSVDAVGNAEPAQSSQVNIDTTPPITTLAVSLPAYLSYVSTASLFTLSAVDPNSNGVASGLKAAFIAVGSGPVTAYRGGFGLTGSDGAKAVSFYSQDNVLNTELLKSTTWLLDATPPQTQFVLFGGVQFQGASGLYASSSTLAALPAADPLVNGVASGLLLTQYADNGGVFRAYASSFTLTEGGHALAYQSADRVQNFEVVRSTTILIDATPPVSAVAFTAPYYQAPDGINYVTPATSVTFSAADPALPTGQPGSGLGRIEVAVDGGSFAVYTASLTFAEGRHTISYRAIDNVGNVNAAQTLAIQSDATAPQTTLAVSGPAFSGFVSTATVFALSATDPVSSSVASGVKFTRYQINGAVFAQAPLAFGLTGPDGAYTIAYQSQDNASNTEVLHSTTVLLDQTPPVTTARVGASFFTAADGTLYVTPGTPVSFTAVDPTSGGPASGVNRIEVALDGGNFAVYAAALTVPEGRHVILYRAVDNVGNYEATRTLALRSDATAPITSFNASARYYTSNGVNFAPVSFAYALAAVDPAVNGVASGVAGTAYRVNGGALAPYTAAFGLSEGIDRIDFQSGDNVGNLELLKTATVYVDATAPATTLSIGQPQFTVSGLTIVSTATPFTLASADPVVQGVAAGVGAISYRVNGNAFAAYGAAFNVPMPDGVQTVGYFAADNVGNAESVKTSTVALDATAPQTELAIVGGRQFPGPNPLTFYASSATLIAFAAADPVAGGVASGVKLTRYQDNGGGFQISSAPLSLTEGAHLIAYQSQDNVSNLEVLHSTAVWVDATAPVTSFAFGTPYFKAADGTNYVTPATPVSLTAADSALPTGQPGSGVHHIEVAVDTGAFGIYTAALTLAQGRHTIFYRAVDNVGNVEATKTLNVQSDATPPVTVLALLGGHQFAGPDAISFYASADTRYGLPAGDPIVNNVASGLAFTRWQDNSGTFQTFVSSFALAEGSHHLGYQSQDNVQNLEVLRSTTALVDATAPLTELAIIGGHQFPGPDVQTFYASSDTRLALPAADPVVSGVASGVSFTHYQDNGGQFLIFSSVFGLTEGAHGLGYQSQDNVANLEVLHSTNVWIDATPPVTSFAFGTQYYQAPDGTNYVTPATSVTFSAADPALTTGQPGSGLNHIEVAIDGGSFVTYMSPLTFTEGRHTILYRSIDNVANVEATKTLNVQSDATPPMTELAVLGGHQFAGPNAMTFYTSADTRLALPAHDPVIKNVASGLVFTRWQDNGGQFQTFASSFTLSEGSHQLGYQSQDNVQNLEVLRSTIALVDATPPVTSFAFGTPYYQAPDGTNYITPTTTVSFWAVDPALPTGQPGSGVNHIELAIDGGAFTPYTAALAFAEGRHTILYRSIDNVANVEATKTLNVQSDNTPPVTELAPLGGHQFAGPDTVSFYASADTRYGLPAVDPIVKNVASGVAFTRFQDNGGPFQTFASPLSLAEGIHHLAYQSQDNVQNLEILRSTTALVDATAPLTELAIIGGHQFPGPNAATFYASSDTRLSLPAYDPLVKNVASGLAFTRSQDNGGTFQTFASAFGLAEGAHAIGYQSQDNVANLEVLHSTNAWIDATPPVTSFVFGTPYYQAPDGTNYLTPATSVTFSAADPALPTGQPGSGVNHIEVAIDGGAFTPYTTALTFAEGRHTILYRAIDNVANVEATKTLNVQSDNTPPITQLAPLGGHQFAGPDAVSFYASADTRYGLPAVDPVVKNVASGVAFTRFEDNGGPFQTFASPFALAEGIHHLGYQSQDNVQNLEVLRSTTALVDATAPLTELAIIGGRQFPGPNAATFYASSDTRLALPAFDPLVKNVASGLAFTRFQDNGGAFVVYGSSFILPEGAHAIAYQSQDNVNNLEVLRSTNAWIDSTPPVTTFAIGTPYYQAPDGTNYITPATPVSFSAIDPALPTGQAGCGVNHIEVAIDGGAFVTYVSPLFFAEGRHTILYRSLDNVGNVSATKTLNIQSDATPPTSVLVIGQPQFALPNILLVSSRTPFAIAAVDSIVSNVASGVKDSWFNVADITQSTGAFAPFTAAFTLSGLDVSKVVAFYSRDNVLNAEVVRSSTVLLDSMPPEVALLSPAACDSGICRVLKGKFPVLGTAKDLHFHDYQLEFAAGQNAAAGYVSIASGTAAVSSGTLGVWDTGALSGWQTLRLTATDLVQNVSALSLNVFVGDPATLMVLGNHDVFNMPEGVAVATDGKIYVADRDNDRIAVFSSTGAMLASFGKRNDDDKDDVRRSTGVLRLNHPSGVAVDASGAIIVADTGNNRVLKLSSTGQVLFQLGRKPRGERGEEGDHDGGRKPGEFNKPAGVALDAAGGLYVSDTENSRVQVFSSTGAFAYSFSLPPLPQRKDGDDSEDKQGHDDDRPDLGKPVGIALDAAGLIYVADPKGHRALVFDPAGTLLLAIPIAGDKPGQFGQPVGVAVSPSGQCLLVSDRKLSRLLKFDFQGGRNLVFGARARDDDDDKKPATIISLRKPAGLALDSSGNLYVADRNNERIKKFGLPTGQPALIVPPPRPEDEQCARDVVDKDDGGKVARKDKAAVDIPAQALADDLKISVSTPVTVSLADDSNRRRALADKTLKVASPPIEFNPEGTQFTAPVTLTLPYNPDLVALQGVSEDDLKVDYWNRDKAQWQTLDSTVDKKSHTVSAKTTHFSLYQVLSGTAAVAATQAVPAAAADATFVFRDLYAFPNPARRNEEPVIRLQVGVADEVDINIYDISGQVVARGSFGPPKILDDNNGKGPQYTYDYLWDTGGAGSGVYIFAVTAKKAGFSPIRKTGKAGVIR